MKRPSRIKSFINKKRHKLRLGLAGFVKERDLKHKTWQLIKYAVEVLITGVLAYYALTHYNPFSIGIAIAMTTYYVSWLVRLIKEKDKKQEDA